MAGGLQRIRGGGAVLALILLLVLLVVVAPRRAEGHRPSPRAQQEYDVTSAAAAAGPCDAYLVFCSSPPLNASVVSISNLLNVTATTVTESNAVDPVVPIAVDPLVFAPVVGDLIPTCRLA
uniref:Uncharacterized protein n=1 Tax=Oryza glumipatula TaxID=40148 RepID=A0A0E0BCU2_9ORYZ